MTKSRIFLILALSFLCGVFAVSFFQSKADAPRVYDDYNNIIPLLLVGSIAVFVINHKNKKAVVASAAVLFLALGVWRMNVSLEAAKNNLTSQKLGPVEFVGIVAKEPELDEKNQKITISMNLTKPEEHTRKPVYGFDLMSSAKTKILVSTPLYPEYSYGDQLKISCVLGEPKNYEDSHFDYQMYLAKDGIYRICNRANILILGSNRGNAAYAFILNIKRKFEERLSKIFPDPEGAYLKGLLLGGSRRMTKDLSEAFQRTGTSHTVAVSGYNVTIVAAFFMWLGIYAGLWRQQVFSFAVLGIVLFILMTGAPSSAVRAGIMGSLVIWAMKEGRLANSTNAILLAAGAMLMINPLLLRYDAGFQLSFLATIGIVQLSPLLEKFFWRKGRAPKLIQETIILTMSAIIFVLPIILNSFEKLPVVSPVANFFILPAIPAIMLGGFIAGIAGFVFVPLGKLVGFLPYIFLKAELAIIQWMANLPGASIEVKNFGWKYIIAYYFLLATILIYTKKKEKRNLQLQRARSF